MVPVLDYVFFMDRLNTKHTKRIHTYEADTFLLTFCSVFVLSLACFLVFFFVFEKQERERQPSSSSALRREEYGRPPMQRTKHN